MTRKSMPAPNLVVRPGAKSTIAPSALDRWSPDVRAADDGDATISILEVIGEDFWGEGVTAKRIAAALRAIGDRPITVSINSPGGNVFEGLAIYNLLREHSQPVTVKVLGVAASAASVIAMAGDNIQIARAGFLMVHNTWVLAAGDKAALRETADWLGPFDEALISIYAARTGLTDKALAAMMDAETWIGGEASVEQDFADSLLPSDQVAVDPAPEGLAMTARAALNKLELVHATGTRLTREQSRSLIACTKSGASDGAVPSGKRGAADLGATLSASLKTLETIASE